MKRPGIDGGFLLCCGLNLILNCFWVSRTVRHPLHPWYAALASVACTWPVACNRLRHHRIHELGSIDQQLKWCRHGHPRARHRALFVPAPQ